MVALAFTDDGDGTGGVFAVSSASGTVSVYASRFNGTNASRTFALVGSLLGNGTVAFNTDLTGAYLGVAISDNGTHSVPIAFRVTNGDSPLQGQLLNAVREYILSLSLPGVSDDPDHHVISKLPYRSNTDLTIDATTDTCVWYFPKTEQYSTADTFHNRVVYPIQVLLVRKIGTQTHKGLFSMLMDRQLIGQSMAWRPFEDAPCFYDVEIQPGEPYNAQHWAAGVDVSSIIVRAITEQPSGVF